MSSFFQTHDLPSYGDRDPCGVMIHTTGDGIPNKAVQTSTYVGDVEVNTYKNMKEGPHFMIDPYGIIYKFRDPEVISYHCGMTKEDRRSLLDGHWENDANRIIHLDTIRAYWKKRFSE